MRNDSTDTDTIHLAGTEAETIADLVRRMILLLGEDPNREGLRRTPERFEKALRYLTSGYRQDPDKLLNG
ncbi:MAG: GTP cyclohydrolase I, partial [Candidatus Acidiferrales bacterium]